MPFRLRTELPADLSGYQHVVAREADIEDVNFMRENNMHWAFNPADMRTRLETGGLTVVRKKIGNDVLPGVYGIAGYLVADVDRLSRRLRVLGMRVREGDQGMGLGGFMLGNLISDGRINNSGNEHKTDFGTSLTMPGGEFKLPGIRSSSDDYTDLELLKRVAHVKYRDEQRGILDIGSSDSPHGIWTVFDEGQPQADLTADDSGAVHVAGQAGEYETDYFAAMAVLNPGSPWFDNQG